MVFPIQPVAQTLTSLNVYTSYTMGHEAPTATFNNISYAVERNKTEDELTPASGLTYTTVASMVNGSTARPNQSWHTGELTALHGDYSHTDPVGGWGDIIWIRVQKKVRSSDTPVQLETLIQVQPSTVATVTRPAGYNVCLLYTSPSPRD